MKHNAYICVAPENIHNPLMVFSLNHPPLWKFHFCSILSFKKMGFGDPPTPWNALMIQDHVFRSWSSKEQLTLLAWEQNYC